MCSVIPDMGGDETLEPLYALINVLVGFVGNYSLFLLVTNLFVLYTYYWFSIKYTPKPVVTFALLLLCASFFLSGWSWLSPF